MIGYTTSQSINEFNSSIAVLDSIDNQKMSMFLRLLATMTRLILPYSS